MTDAEKIRVLLVDDHPIVLDGIRSRLERQETIEIVDSAENGRVAVEKTRELEPDIVLMDISMPEMNGLEATQAIMNESSERKVLVLTMHDDREYITEIVRAGARGYIFKDSSPADLLQAIEIVHKGGSFFSPAASQVLLEDYAKGPKKGTRKARGSELSAREQEVLALIANGLSNKQIAAELHLSVRTVETHRERIMRKLDIHSAAGLTKYAIAKGIVGIDD